MPSTALMPLEITVTRTQRSRLTDLDLTNVAFGKVFTDHMFVCDFRDGAWQTPEIKPFGPLLLSPATMALHYGQEIFEGLKAYTLEDGSPVLFRPRENFKRMNKSAHRLVMPELPEELFVEGIKELVSIDRAWIPQSPGASLYIRPFMFATDEHVGVKPSDGYSFVVIACPVNAYYPDPIKLKIERDYVRAAHGGTGEAKCAGNYGASLYAAQQAKAEGYAQVLWTDAMEHKWLEEAGTMNVFFVIGDTVVTPEIDGIILQGVTRSSILALLKDNEYKVEERRISIDEVVAAHEAGTLREVFGAGTAATVAYIDAIGFDGRELALDGSKREVSRWCYDTLEGIKRGKLLDRHNWLLPV